MLLYSCSFDKKTETNATESSDETAESADVQIMDGSSQDIADRLSTNLTDNLIPDELEFLEPEQRTFRYAQADLNEDGQLEYLIELRNSFFCGTGGCTYFLVNASGDLLTSFTVSDAPFYVLAGKTNGWHDLVIPRDGVHNLIQHNGSSYPSNPSMEPEVMLDELSIMGTLISDSNTREFTF
jgi:hypothetical protein